MPELTREQQKERIRQRVKAAANLENYRYFPEKENIDCLKSYRSQRACIYARVSTDDLAQVTSLELQQKYYRDMLIQNCDRVLAKNNSDQMNAVVSADGDETEENPDA